MPIHCPQCSPKLNYYMCVCTSTLKYNYLNRLQMKLCDLLVVWYIIYGLIKVVGRCEMSDRSRKVNTLSCINVLTSFCSFGIQSIIFKLFQVTEYTTTEQVTTTVRQVSLTLLNINYLQKNGLGAFCASNLNSSHLHAIRKAQYTCKCMRFTSSCGSVCRRRIDISAYIHKYIHYTYWVFSSVLVHRCKLCWWKCAAI